MIIGLDFDNTLVCYDGLFHRAAVDRGLIPADTPSEKEAVRNELRAADREDAWTELQGLVYGHEIQAARPFPGAAAFLRECAEREIVVCIVSHRTRQPFAGPPLDMHRAAREWLDAREWFTQGPFGLAADRVYFEETKDAKLDRIATLGCGVFVDDLPELLHEPGFPQAAKRILFDPHATGADVTGLLRAGSWPAVSDLLFRQGRS